MKRIWKKNERHSQQARIKADNTRRNYGPRAFFGKPVGAGILKPHGNDRRRAIRKAG